MTGIISEDALRSQQSRIMNAMKANAAPTSQSISPQDLLQASMAGNRPGGDYFAALKAAQTAQTAANLATETGIYTQMKEQAARGNEEAAAIDKAIIDVAGDDPKLYSSLAQDLHKDPEDITRSNVKSKVMMYAAQRGIVPLTTQESKAKISRLQAEANKIQAGPEEPASIREWNKFNAMTPAEKQEYIHMKRTGGDEALDKKLGELGAKDYADLQERIHEAENFTSNIDVAREKLAAAKMTGPIFGRIGKAASDPAYIDWQGSKNGLTLLAKSIYGMPNANFSDADRNFLDQITGGEFPRKEAAERTIDRLELIANKAIRQARKNQQDILERKTYNRETKTKETPKTDYKSKYGLE